jgi:hypothetical protein
LFAASNTVIPQISPTSQENTKRILKWLNIANRAVKPINYDPVYLHNTFLEERLRIKAKSIKVVGIFYGTNAVIPLLSLKVSE